MSIKIIKISVDGSLALTDYDFGNSPNSPSPSFCFVMQKNCQFFFSLLMQKNILLISSWLTIKHLQCGGKVSESVEKDYIVNGKEADEHAHPWQVKLKRKLHFRMVAAP